MSSGEKKTREEMANGFYQNLLLLNKMFESVNIPVIFMANIPASEKNEQDGADYWRILHMCDINELYKKFSAETGATLFSLYDAFSAHCAENEIAVDSLLCDGLHPNDEGYDVMFSLIVKAFGA